MIKYRVILISPCVPSTGRTDTQWRSCTSPLHGPTHRSVDLNLDDEVNC